MIKLFPHQTKALSETSQFNRVAYYLDMGLGKTFVGSEKMISFNTPINILVCQKSKIQDWIDHFRTNYDWIDDVLDLSVSKNYKLFSNLFYENIPFPPRYCAIGIINYELAFRRTNLLKAKNFSLMLDESSMITNPTAKRTKFIHALKPNNVILLSGTPTGGKYEKLWSQLKLLGWDITKEAFWKTYVEIKWIEDESGFKIQTVAGYKNVDRLKRKLSDHGCVFMKTEEAFELPEQIEIPVMVEKTEGYSYFMRNSIVTLENGIQLIGDTKLTKRMFARQLCGQYNEHKFEAFCDLIGSTEDRLIVFYNFNEELKRLTEIAHNLGRPTSLVNGETKDLTNYEEQSNSVTFVQYQAGAMGLNLQKANKIIYFTLPQASDLFEQSKKRIHRIGQRNTCFYYFLLCKNSVEEDILETLRMRKDYDDNLFIKYEQERS